MATTKTTENFYVSGGTLPTSALSYVRRSADDVLYQALTEGEFCYILTSRQMGKSSMTTQAAQRLREAGVTVALLDFSGIGFNLQPEQWYNGLLEHLGRRLDLEDDLCHLDLVTLKGHTDPVTSVAFSPDGRRIVTSFPLAGRQQTASD